MNEKIMFNYNSGDLRKLMLKETALLYLKDALRTERFEECPEIIAMAKKYGAVACEVRAVISAYVMGEPAGLSDEESAQLGGRLGFKKGA